MSSDATWLIERGDAVRVCPCRWRGMSEPASHPLPWVRRMSGRDPGEAHRASTPLELLFDLTFVVAVARAGIELRDALAQGHAGHALAGTLTSPRS